MSPVATSRWPRWALVVLLTALATLALSACTVTSLVGVQTTLTRAGFSGVRVAPHDNGQNGTVTVTVHTDGAPSNTDVHEVAHVVWTHLHNRFDDVAITVAGNGRTIERSFSFDQLQASFGPRDPAWNRTSLVSGLKGFGLGLIAVLVVVALVIVAIVVLVRLRRRRRPPPVGPQPGWGSPATPWGPAPGPGSGWQQYEPPADRR